MDIQDIAIAEYCKESERDGFLFSVDNGCSLDKSNGYCAGYINGFKKGYVDQQERIAELENIVKDLNGMYKERVSMQTGIPEDKKPMLTPLFDFLIEGDRVKARDLAKAIVRHKGANHVPLINCYEPPLIVGFTYVIPDKVYKEAIYIGLDKGNFIFYLANDDELTLFKTQDDNTFYPVD